MRSAGGIRPKPRRSFKSPRIPRSKHALQVTYIIDGRGIVCGTTTGDVCVWDTANGEVYQVLNHDKDEIIQAVAVGSEYSPSLSAYDCCRGSIVLVIAISLQQPWTRVSRRTSRSGGRSIVQYSARSFVRYPLTSPLSVLE